MIYPMVPFSVTLSDPQSKFQGHGIIIDVLDVLCAQLPRDLFAIAKFLYLSYYSSAFYSLARCNAPLVCSIF